MELVAREKPGTPLNLRFSAVDRQAVGADGRARIGQLSMMNQAEPRFGVASWDVVGVLPGSSLLGGGVCFVAAPDATSYTLHG